MDVSVTFKIRLSLEDTEFASADDLGASVDSQLNDAVSDGSQHSCGRLTLVGTSSSERSTCTDA